MRIAIFAGLEYDALNGTANVSTTIFKCVVMCRNMLTIPKNQFTIISKGTNVRCYRFYRKGNYVMKNYEKELAEIIRENDNPEQAVLVAIKVFSAFLEQLEEAPTLRVVGQ